MRVRLHIQCSCREPIVNDRSRTGGRKQRRDRTGPIFKCAVRSICDRCVISRSGLPLEDHIGRGDHTYCRSVRNNDVCKHAGWQVSTQHQWLNIDYATNNEKSSLVSLLSQEGFARELFGLKQQRPQVNGSHATPQSTPQTPRALQSVAHELAITIAAGARPCVAPGRRRRAKRRPRSSARTPAAAPPSRTRGPMLDEGSLPPWSARGGRCWVGGLFDLSTFRLI